MARVAFSLSACALLAGCAVVEPLGIDVPPLVPPTEVPPTAPVDPPADVRAAELAVQPRSGAAEHSVVRTFRADRPVYVGFDPAELPGVITCDIVVSEDRSAGEWAADPALVDVRGNPIMHVFGDTRAGTLAEIAGPGELSGIGPDGRPGRGYDLVLDCDRDGLLSAGDVIDGYDGAGFHVVSDLAAPGPHGVVQVSHDAGPWLRQSIWMPADLEDLGQVPVVMIAHGYGHELGYYGHLGEHLASHGYVVSSFRNDVGDGDGPATETASTTLLTNTEHLLQAQGTIAGGVLDGHLDASRIVWIGHSTGGECVVRAYTRLRDGSWTSPAFDASSIALVSSMAPVAWLGKAASNPYDVPYHLITGGADRDTGNYPEDGYTQNMTLFERATGDRWLTYIHGAGHGDLHDGPQNWLDSPDPLGPALIGPAGAHPVVQSTHLALIEWTTRGNPAMPDLFERSDDDLGLPGIPDSVHVTREHRPSLAAGHLVIDDFQTGPSPGLSSAGTSVTGDVEHVAEIRMDDQDWSYAWTGTQPANGMTRASSPADDARCVVFDWSAGSTRFVEFEVPEGERDLRGARTLAFRAAQGTRHPLTDALDGPLSFTVVLVDGQGSTGALDFGAYGTIPRPYQRTGSGAGAGWANEFASVRLPIRDFAAPGARSGAPLDLADIVAVRLEVGDGRGSPQGRVAFDDLTIER